MKSVFRGARACAFALLLVVGFLATTRIAHADAGPLYCQPNEGNEFSITSGQTFTIDPDCGASAIVTGPTHGTLTNVGSGVWTYTTTGNYSGQDTFTVSVSSSIGNGSGGQGDFSGGGGNETVTFDVQPPSTTTSLSSGVNPSVSGQPVSYLAQVTSGGGTPVGTVQFQVNGANVGSSIPVDGSGNATSATMTPPTGSDTITAVFTGTNYGNSSGSTQQTVNQGATTTAVLSSASPSSVGQNVTFTATVTATSPATGSPGGTVTFSIDSVAQTPSSVSGGSASFSTTTLTPGNHNITATYNGDTNFTTSTFGPLVQNVGTYSTTVVLASSQNPSPVGTPITITATVNHAGTITVGGTITFTVDGVAQAPVNVSGNQAAFTISTLTSGSHTISATFSGDASYGNSNAPVLTQVINIGPTTTTIASSANPSQVGQAVTFSATVASSAGTPTGTVNFVDGGTSIGSATLASGIAKFTTSSLTRGNHSIVATYAGATTFSSSSSSALSQAVATPADSLKLRAMQAMVGPTVAQASGNIISGAIDTAIGEAFSDGGAPVNMSASGAHVNFSADPSDADTNSTVPTTNDPFSNAFTQSGRNTGSLNPNRPTAAATSTSRVDDAFGALGYAGPTKAPPLRATAPKEWFAWADVRGVNLDRYAATGGPSLLYGNQVNALFGLTRKLTPNLVVGALTGYETFDYRSDVYGGRLKGDGWTVGSYLGWKISQRIRFDAAVAYSGIGYDGTAGSASGSYGGTRWMVSGGFTGAYNALGIAIEPSARVYALWEHENAYTDSLSTLQTARDFSSGRASAGAKFAYPVAWSSSVALAPYAGIYGDYYFNSDTIGAVSTIVAGSDPSSVILDGWSARAVAGIGAKFGNDAQISIGMERGGIGSNFALWTYLAKGSIPFSAH